MDRHPTWPGPATDALAQTVLDPVQFWVGLVGGGIAIIEALRRSLTWLVPRWRQVQKVRLETVYAADTLVLYDTQPHSYTRFVLVNIYNDSAFPVRHMRLVVSWDGDDAALPIGDLEAHTNYRERVPFSTEGRTPINHVPSEFSTSPEKKGTTPPAYSSVTFNDALGRRWWLDENGRLAHLFPWRLPQDRTAN